MQILNKENLLFEILPETIDDLWALSRFIDSGDIIYSSTQRKVKIGEKGKQVTKIIYVELLVKKILFETEVLRVTGEIQNETEFTAIGQSHTFTFKPTDIIKVQKSNLLKFQEEILEKSLKSKHSQNLLIILDKDDLLVSEFSDFSFKVLVNESGLGSKKYHSKEINEEEEKYEIIKPLLDKNYNSVIISGPGNYKEKLKKYLDLKGVKKTITFHWFDVNSSSIQKLIRSIFQSKVLSQNQLSNESDLVSIFLKNVNKGEKYSYGFKNVLESLDMGSIESLLITTKFIDNKKEEGNYDELNSLMKNVESLSAKILILNSKNEPGKIIDGLGGIAAILRY